MFSTQIKVEHKAECSRTKVQKIFSRLSILLRSRRIRKLLRLLIISRIHKHQKEHLKEENRRKKV